MLVLLNVKVEYLGLILIQKQPCVVSRMVFLEFHLKRCIVFILTDFSFMALHSTDIYFWSNLKIIFYSKMIRIFKEKRKKGQSRNNYFLIISDYFHVR